MVADHLFVRPRHAMGFEQRFFLNVTDKSGFRFFTLDNLTTVGFIHEITIFSGNRYICVVTRYGEITWTINVSITR